MNDIHHLLKHYRDDGLRPGTRAFSEFRRLLTSPLQVTESHLLDDDHPLKVQAYIVLDAFESVTNGMENHQAMEELQRLDAHSVFHPWKVFILALQAFYREDDTTCRQLLQSLPTGTPLHALAQDLLGESAATPKRKLRQLWSVDPAYRECLEQVESTAYPENQLYFLDTLLESRPLWEGQSEAARIVFARWVMHLVLARNLCVKQTVKALIRVVGRWEAERAVALALFRDSIEAACVFLARSLIDKEGPITFEERSLMREMYRQALLYQRDGGVDADFQREWVGLRGDLERRGVRLDGLEVAGETAAHVRRAAKKSASQLELFAS